jgi:uncharacterized protein (DUF2267 family)
MLSLMASAPPMMLHLASRRREVGKFAERRLHGPASMTHTATTHDLFEATLHKTDMWLSHLMRLLATNDRHVAYLALRATLHALRDRITLEEVAQLGAQLPMLIRGVYYEGWDPTGKPLKIRQREQFLERITSGLALKDRKEPEDMARAVFTLLVQRISDGEIEDVKHVLPRDIRDLWP